MLPPIEILYQDSSIIAVNKVPGMIVHRNEFTHDVRDSLLMLLRRQVNRYLYPLHRLDRPTSGVVLFALEKGAAQKLSEAFQKQEMEKEYLAIVRGFAAERGTIDAPLRKKPTQEYQKAITQFRKIAQCEVPLSIGPYLQSRYSLLSVMPKTGRHHQIRRHLANHDFPILGDKKHGDRAHNRVFSDRLNLPGLMLHAQVIRFVHPISQQAMVITAPLSPGFQKVMSFLGWRDILNPPYSLP